jgi:hypothetical protein
MTDEEFEQKRKEHEQHMEERKGLIDASRESLRTFDQAVLAFGAAVFGASVAFLKDVAPKPQPFTLPWLGVSWICFMLGLLAVILSFLFSHRACHAKIDESAEKLNNPTATPADEKWGRWTNVCNYSCVGFLFFGVVAWIIFALENLAKSGGK